MHVDFGERFEDVGHVDQLDPVELDVLARRPVAEALVPAPRDIAELAQLAARHGAIGDGDAQHVGVKLEVEPVHQAQGLEFVLGQFAGKTACDLGAEFPVAVLQEGAVEFVVTVHQRISISVRSLKVWRWAARIFSRTDFAAGMPLERSTSMA